MAQEVIYLPPFGFSERKITKQEWAKIGCPDDTKSWNKRNNFTIPLNEFSKEAIAYIHTDDGLEIVGDDESSPPDEPASLQWEAAWASDSGSHRSEV